MRVKLLKINNQNIVALNQNSNIPIYLSKGWVGQNILDPVPPVGKITLPNNLKKAIFLGYQL